MTESLFTNIFSYRQRENNSPLENFVSEIFAFCLKDDELYRCNFFSLFEDISYAKQDCQISTQEEYEFYGRPDIELNFADTSILFECKIEAIERKNQLTDYASILINQKKAPNKHIIFITKYFEHKDLQTSKVKLHLLRWFEVARIITTEHKQITQQFKQFLKEKDMEAVKNFTIQDLMAMKAIPATITKMDELLEQFKPEFEKMFGGYSKDSSRSSKLQNSLYINFVTLTYSKINYWLLIGFFWNWHEDEVEVPHIGISIEIPVKKLEHTDLIDILDKELGKNKNWEYEEYENSCYYSAVTPLTNFITQSDDDIPAMKKYINSNLQTLYKLRDKYPKLLKK